MSEILISDTDILDMNIAFDVLIMTAITLPMQQLRIFMRHPRHKAGCTNGVAA